MRQKSPPDLGATLSCFSPPGVHFENYQEFALAAGEPKADKTDEGGKVDDDDFKRHMPEVDIGDNGMPLPTSTATEVADDGKPSSADGGAQAQAGELAHVGTIWPHTGDVWRCVGAVRAARVVRRRLVLRRI